VGLVPFLILMAIMVLATGVPTARATVEDWPVGIPNTCKSSDDFFLNFEAGIDDIQIESTIPSMEFTTTGTLNWVYGDIRTGSYNVDHSGSLGYVTNGNFFAWLGTLGDQGRIDFLGGGASYCSVLVSTASGLTLDAYDSGGTLIATSGWAVNNTYSGKFTRLTVEAPAGKTIAYVMVHDTGNFWLMDDLCTDANKAVIPVPTRTIGSHSDRFDLVFVPDNDYGLPADIDTWLPNFIQAIQNQIDQRLVAAAPVTGHLDSFNFYYTRMQGDAAHNPHILPANITRVAPFADAYVILHNAEFGDWTEWGPPPVFSAEVAVGRSFIHEGGHAIFVLADEYDDAPGCATARFEPNPMPNVWDTEADCRTDVTAEGWGNANDCWRFTTCTSDWWKFGTTRFIMDDGNFFNNGWGQPASRRVEWVLGQNPGTAPAEPGGSDEATKSIWLNMQVSAGAFSLLKESYVLESPPSYLPVVGSFMIKVFSNGDAVLNHFGMHDPRIVQGEPGYVGPTWRDTVNFQLVVPYFKSCGRVDLIESATGDVKLSVDISKYATVVAPIAVCKNIEVALDEDGQATISAGDIDGGSYAPDGGSVALSIDKSHFTCADLGQNSVILTATDDEGAPGACTAIVTVKDTIPPVLSGVPADATVQCDSVPSPASVTATDNCDTNVVPSFYQKRVDGSCTSNYTLSRTWTAADHLGNKSSATQIIQVVDTTAPVIQSIAAAPNVLWTANHKMVHVAVTAKATDNCSRPVCKIASVTSNEPVNGLGDGDTAPDWSITGDLTVDLRAERSGTGSGRIYTIAVTCTDACGNSSVGNTTVTVPHDQNKK
jgi:hypothetical protein